MRAIVNIFCFLFAQHIYSQFCFSTPFSLYSGSSPRTIISADFNNDSILDLAVANTDSSAVNCSPNTISILIGNGNGAFNLTHSIPTNLAPISIINGDFDRDGNSDIVCCNYFSNSVDVFLGTGTGSFVLTSSISIAEPRFIESADFNSDGFDDLAIACESNASGKLKIFFSNGDGTFNTLKIIPIINTLKVKRTDINNDGNQDAITLNAGNYNIAVLIGDGLGNFSIPIYVYAGVKPVSFTIEDFDNDTFMDIVAVNYNFLDGISVLKGDGTGWFGSPINYSLSGGYHTSIVNGDFDGDGNIDVAISNEINKTITLMKGNGKCNFGSETVFPIGFNQTELLSNDFNGDSKPDIVSANYFSNNVSVLLNCNTVGFPDLSLEKEMAVFPNPADTEFTIKLNETTKYSITIYDINGKEVFKDTNAQGKNVNVSNLEEGVYLLKINNNKNVINKKLFVLH